VLQTQFLWRFQLSLLRLLSPVCRQRKANKIASEIVIAQTCEFLTLPEQSDFESEPTHDSTKRKIPIILHFFAGAY